MRRWLDNKDGAEKQLQKTVCDAAEAPDGKSRTIRASKKVSAAQG